MAATLLLCNFRTASFTLSMQGTSRVQFEKLLVLVVLDKRMDQEIKTVPG